MEPVIISVPMFSSPITQGLIIALIALATVRGVARMIKMIPFL